MSSRALIIIDLQNDYFPGGRWTLHAVDRAAENAARLIQSARANEELVVHVRHEFPSDDAPFFVQGSDGARIHDKVLPADGEPVVLKNQVNSFRDTSLKEILDRHGVRDVTICGAMSHMCVDAGVRAASDLGFPVTVIHDACASRDMSFKGVTVGAEDVHAAFMAALDFGYANVLSTDEYLGADVS